MAKRLLILVCALAIAIPAMAQNPTGTITGRVVDDQGGALPGVTVTVSSPNMQGARTAVTSVNGDYIFRSLPPGDYNVKFELSGFVTVDTQVKVSAAQTQPVNATMAFGQIAEELTVVGSLETISATTDVATTFESDLLEDLPVGRTMIAAAALTPGVAATGPSGNLTISGALSYENLFMVNGVVVNDNVRNTPNTLFIEDAIQETTTSTANVSAEYGRFAGGVVNTLTKSGGNQFSGSLRLSLDNDDWQATAPLQTVEYVDEVNQTWEATLGGFIIKDHLWFFAAGRSRETETSQQTYNTNLGYTATTDQKRYEGKLTYSLSPNHRIIASYMGIDTEQTNNAFGTILDMASLDNSRSMPQDQYAINYSGVITDNFFLEGQYSRREYTFKGSGGEYTDLIKGTVIRDNLHYWRSNSPTFCGVCDPEERNNEDWLVKGSWFASTENLGTHDVVFGIDSFNDMRKANNYQSGSNWTYWPTQYLEDANGKIVLDPSLNQPIPVVYGGDSGSSDFTLWAMLEQSKGTNFITNSVFINDKWRFSKNLSFNIGVRYDQNDGEDASHNKVADDDRISPRLGVSWDPTGEGNWTINAGYGHYVTAIAGSVADQGGGSPSQFGYFYEGPDINTECTVNNTSGCLNAHQVLEQVFAWLFANGKDAYGRPIGRDVVYGYVAGLSQVVGENLKSPYAEEYTIGFTKRLGTKGIVRADYIHRDYNDLYATRVDMSTGQVEDELGNVSDLKVIENTDQLTREYDGINLQASYRMLDNRLMLGGNYTWSKSWGNYEGETAGSGPVSNSSNANYYPEYSRQSWTNPEGYLSNDQRHRARLYAVFDIFDSNMHSLSVSMMQSFFSGTPYSATGTVYVYPYVTNPGYAQRPATTTYYFSDRGEYKTEDVTRTDLSFNYAFKVAGVELFVQPEVTNLFNERAVTNVNTTVYTRYNGSNWPLFDPFNSTPKECPQGTSGADCKTMGGNWQKSATFGKPMGPGDYQAPRTFQVSFGVRF